MNLTPTKNHTLPLILGEFDTLADALDYAACGETGVNFYNTFGQLTTVMSYKTLRACALKLAVQLRRMGLNPDDRLAIIAESRVEFLMVFFACQYGGIIPCPLPFSLYLGGREGYIQTLANMLKHAKAHAVVTPKSIDALFVDEKMPLDLKVHTFEQLADACASAPLIPQRAGALYKNDGAYIQFSSGSTAEPKGVLVTQKALCANIGAILQVGMALHDKDRAFSWLPFYHDMGLVGFALAPICGQRSVDYLSPSSFVRRPTLWLELMSNNKSTITYAPTFGYQLAMLRLKEGADLDLSLLRIAGIGGDMIAPNVLTEFSELLAPCGFNGRAFMPSYGMAEATLAVSMVGVDEVPMVDTLAGRAVVSCGRPLPHIVIAVLNGKHHPLPEREIGAIWIKGPSIVPQYLNGGHENLPNQPGLINTGDLGYLFQGQLFITGRSKDLIIIRGRNIWPQDVEWALEENIHSIRHGDVAAIMHEAGGNEQLVVIIQCRSLDEASQNTFKKAVQAIINQFIGVEATIVLVKPHSLPRTSSGKLARAKIKILYQRDQLAILINHS